MDFVARRDCAGGAGPVIEGGAGVEEEVAAGAALFEAPNSDGAVVPEEGAFVVVAAGCDAVVPNKLGALVPEDAAVEVAVLAPPNRLGALPVVGAAELVLLPNRPPPVVPVAGAGVVADEVAGGPEVEVEVACCAPPSRFEPKDWAEAAADAGAAG